MTELVYQAVDFLASGIGVGMVIGLFLVLVASAFCAVVHTIAKVMNGGR